ncbi:SDR family oxidoreductase [Mucilaginibacter ginkgonis]|uniref:SDR family oxidoreductase n=1 Tax=Mucilaginibacter ginkgonis TaxID=2682091 RepID=A0A6I4I0F5_9SPHI|nr:SDR family oxidoreductase [Mucilaginibacter ginkgonis]QQL50959.1 SDR family oxidoreductase [Mucilaginibacter ginkgonis]
MNLKDKVVVITGASSGIGKAMVYEFASRGANVVLAARQYVTLCEISEDVQKKYPVKALSIQCDVSKEGDCESMIKQTVATFARIDVLVNNAGITMRALFKDMDLSVFKSVMDINFWGTVYCTRYAMPQLLANKGTVVGISSISGIKGLPSRSAYSASKFAMNGFLDSLRTENLHTGLNVLIACPGFTASNIRNVALDKNGNQQGESNLEEDKMMTAEEVAKRIATGVENKARTLVMTTQGKLTNLLSKFVPGLLDKLVYNVFAKEKDSLLK